MKMPTGKNKTLAIGGAVVGGLALMMYIRNKRNAQSTAASTDTSGYDPNAIDPSTGLPYGQEANVDPQTGLTYAQESGLGYGYAGSAVTQSGSATSGIGGTYTTNTQWMSDALQAAQNYYGATYTLATAALGKYLAQDPTGLQANEYSLVSEVVAQIGQPPVNGPYRLIQNNTTPPPSGGGTTTPPPPPPPPPAPPAPPSDNGGVPAGYHMQPPQVASLAKGTSLHMYWQTHYAGNNQALTNLISYNPGLNANDTQHPGVTQIRTSEAHLVPNN